MFTRSKQALVLALVLAVPALAMAAAAPDKAEKVAEKMLNFDKALGMANAQIDATLASMNAMSQPEGNLVDKYKEFTKNIDKLQKMADKAKSNAEAATSQREAYMKQWQDSQAKIQNEQLKAASEARRAELAPKIEAIKSNLTSAGTNFKPFMQDLKDLSLFLGASLNPGTVSSAAELMAKCTAAGGEVKSSVEKGSAAVKDLANSLKPGGPAK